MRVLLVDAAYPLGSDSLGVGAQWLRWKCRRCGIDTAMHPAGCDACFVSSVSPVDAPTIVRIRAALGAMPVVVGGSGALSPAAFIRHGAAACVLGDGSAFIEAASGSGLSAAMQLPNVMTRGNLCPCVDGAFDYSCPVFTSEDGVRRIVIGRGCRHKCLFCHTSWSTPYTEHTDPTAAAATAAALVARGDSVGYVTNDISQHAWSKCLPPSGDGSFSVDYLRKTGMPAQRQIRLGIEGVSERLRAYVKKPITGSDLVACTSWLNGGGKSVRWFLIAGLPTEAATDWDELRAAVQAWKQCTPKGVLALSFTAWCPDPSTPLAAMPIRDDYWRNWESFREWFFGGVGWSNRVKLMAPQQPKSRLEKAILAMDATEMQLRTGGAQGGNGGVVYPFAKQCAMVRERLTTA